MDRVPSIRRAVSNPSCRVLRKTRTTFLLLCSYADSNVQLASVNVTTPANFFHCLRRQVQRDFRKPLIVASPKKLLRDKRCMSTLEDMGPGTQFRRVIGETDEAIGGNTENVKVRHCSCMLCTMLYIYYAYGNHELIFCIASILARLFSRRRSHPFVSWCTPSRWSCTDLWLRLSSKRD
jgi:hypothetical protein